MIDLENKIITSNISIFYVYMKNDVNIDNGDFLGSVLNESYNFAMDFNSFRNMMEVLEGLFNYVNFPMATHEERVFQKKENKNHTLPKELYPATLEMFKNQKPEFRLHVQFRQNATWQGTLQWISTRKTKRFRSELELLELMLNAMHCEL